MSGVLLALATLIAPTLATTGAWAQETQTASSWTSSGPAQWGPPDAPDPAALIPGDGFCTQSSGGTANFSFPPFAFTDPLSGIQIIMKYDSTGGVGPDVQLTLSGATVGAMQGLPAQIGGNCNASITSSVGGDGNLLGTALTQADFAAGNVGVRVFGPVGLLDGVQLRAFFTPPCGNGIVDGTEECDLGANNGVALFCCSGTCTFVGGDSCQPAAGDCDEAEFCPNDSSTCPADDKKNGNICNATTGDPICDPPEKCDGVSNNCPADTGITMDECNPSLGFCDPAEFCDGANPDCPMDMLEPLTTLCNMSLGDCDPDEFCDGVNPVCPPDLLEPDTTLCRPMNPINACDIPDFCTGVDVDCPPDEQIPRCGCRGGP